MFGEYAGRQFRGTADGAGSRQDGLNQTTQRPPVGLKCSEELGVYWQSRSSCGLVTAILPPGLQRKTQTFGAWEVSPLFVRQFYVGLELLGVGLFAAVNWEIIARWLTAKRKQEERKAAAREEAHQEALEKAVDAIKQVLDSWTSSDASLIANLTYLTDRLKRLGIVFAVPSAMCFDKKEGVDFLTCLHLMLKHLEDNDIVKTKAAVRYMITYYSDSDPDAL